MKKTGKIFVTGLVCLVVAQQVSGQSFEWGQKFEQLGTELPSPNEYRAASGAPGEKYWQQRADYVINVEINDANQVLTGSERITYYNNSPIEDQT